MKIGIIKEGKNPPDSRTPLTPAHCKNIMQQYPQVEIVIEPSDNRCFSNEEYALNNVNSQDDLSDCDILLGVKEVPENQLIADKTYFFFSHTIKKQEYNRKLLQTVLDKKIRLIDYEVLTDARGERLIAFGYYAGMVGAHNAIFTYGHRSKKFILPRLIDCYDYESALKIYKKIEFPAFKVILTGKGRVGSGAVQVLSDMGIRHVSPDDFLKKEFDFPVFSQIDSEDYVTRKDGEKFKKEDYYANPEEFQMDFKKYYTVADIFVNGIYYDPKAPAFFDVDEMNESDFNIQVIADVTCDIVPHSSVPSTLFASTIKDPIYGFDPSTGKVVAPHESKVDMMTIDNLPNEIPRDSSGAFSDQFVQNILPEILKAERSSILANATIAENGKLTPKFNYLQSFVEESAQMSDFR